jgi:DNA-binding MarR family transcriptional regulator
MSERSPTATTERFLDWVSGEGGWSKAAIRRPGFQKYFEGIAEARYVIRRVLRIVDEQAREAGLDPLEHQALIQVFGAEGSRLRVNQIADRLGLASAHASRLVKALEAKGLVTRSSSPTDRRGTQVEATEEGRNLLGQIDESVHFHVDHLQRQLTDSERVAALGIFAFYLGIAPRLEELTRTVAARRKAVT